MANEAAEKSRAKIAEAQALIDAGPDGAQLRAEAAARAIEDARTAVVMRGRTTAQFLQPIS